MVHELSVTQLMKYFATTKSTAVIDNPLLLRNRPKNQLVFGVQTSTDSAFYFQVPKTEAFEIVAFKGHATIGTESMNKTIDSRRTNLFEGSFEIHQNPIF